MLRSVEVRDYRGLKHLRVDGLGRVNLIVGKNDSGKTTLLEVLSIASEPHEVARIVMAGQARRNLRVPATDFDNYWKPLFYAADADRGFEVQAQVDGGLHSVALKRVPGPQGALPANLQGLPPLWTLLQTAQESGQSGAPSAVFGFANQVLIPPNARKSRGLWSHIGAADDANDLALFSALKQDAGDGVVRKLLKHIEPELEAIEILAPGGVASIYVRPAASGPMLPLKSMGMGFQHCFDIALCLGSAGIEFVIFDEVDNGLHHSLLAPVWRWIAQASKERGAQVHLTTHSEECVAAAARVFQELGDDGLRVIRIERGEDGSKASVYDAHLAAVAVEEGVEMRGD